MTTTSYRSYLLRLWLEPNNPTEWRAMLESPVSGERYGFASIESLFGFIEKETERMRSEKDLMKSRKKLRLQRHQKT
jgi:hypothetical protein